MNTIKMLDLKGKLETIGPDELILDVRGPEEYRSGHLAGSRNIPYDQVENHIEELMKYKIVYIYCHAGRRAELAAQVLLQAGLKNLVCVPGSGMKDWLGAGLPVVK